MFSYSLMMNKKANNIPWERIEARLEELQKDQQWLRETLGIAPAVLTNWKSRGTPVGKAVPVARALGLTTDQLLGLDSSPHIAGASPVTDDEDMAPSTVAIRMAPEHVRAGITGFGADHVFEDGGHYHLRRLWLEERDLAPGALLAIKIKGDSMRPLMFEGDVVVVNVTDKSRVNGSIFALNFKGESVVKRLKYERREWYLTSENPDFPQEPCRPGDCDVIGRVVYFEARNFKDRL